MRLLFLLILIGLILPFVVYSQQPHSDKIGLGVEIGHWRPNDLSSSVDLAPSATSKTHPYLGLMLLLPWRWGMTFRAGVGYWHYCNNASDPGRMTIEIGSLSIDLKYTILPDVMLMPYLSYGIGWFAGKALRSPPRFSAIAHSDELGMGANIGTGFDFRFSRRINLAMEFRYHYVKFKRIVAFTDDYSGPKISIGLIYWF